ncbi:MAG: hypothetical protein GF364_03475 [Candidatus Lokiarchaeota archaeon]|nr:hypothetical protein [Candidatus Lokiarchaeota archaeon]
MISKNDNNTFAKLTKYFLKSERCCFQGAIVFFALGVLFVIGGSMLVGTHRAKQTREAKEFIEEIVESVHNKTGIFLKYSSFDSREQLQNYSKEMSSSFFVYVYDYTFGTFEALIFFDNGKKFNIEVVALKNKKFKVQLFEPSKWE